MSTDLQITFLGTAASEAVAARIRERAHALQPREARLVLLHASVEIEHKHQAQGRPITVRLVATLAGHAPLICRSADEDAHLAVHQAFDELERQLRDLGSREKAARRDTSVPQA